MADGKDHTVRVFAASGLYRYAISRRGQGPGDLNRLCCLMLESGGLLWVEENGNHRYSRFRLGETEATFVGSVPGATNYVVSPDRVDFDARGRLVDLGLAYLAATKAYEIVRLRLDPAGAVVESDIAPTPSDDSLSSVSFAAGGGIATYSQPYGAQALYAFGAGGEVAHGVSSNYAFAWTDANGRLRTLARRDVGEGPTLSDRERSSTDSLLLMIAANS